MRKEATLKDWNALYEIAIKIKKLKPWEHLWDLDTITILLPDKEPIMCSIMGRAGEFYGIGAYIGLDAIRDFFTMLDKNNFPQEQMVRYQDDNVILCNFGNRDDLTSKELKLVKELDFKFRGKNNWIYFHSYKKGYVPYILDEGEVLMAIEIFGNLYMSLRTYIEEGLEVDFEGGNTLMRMYDSEEELWFNFQAPIEIPSPQHMEITLEDEILLNKISKLKINKSIWELDISYLDMTIRDKSYDRPGSGRVAVLADGNSGIIISQSMLSPTDDEIQIILGMIIQAIIDYGRPQKIRVRDEYIYYLLNNLCNSTNIKLEIKERLNAIDTFIKEFSSFRN